MPRRTECVVCRFKLPLCKRVDTQYCGGTCRVRAFRAHRQGRPLAGRWDREAGRLPDPAPDSPLTRARHRLAIERALRAEREQRSDLEKRLSQIEREAAEQRRSLAEEREARSRAVLRENTRADELRQILEDEREAKEIQRKEAARYCRLLDEAKARSEKAEAEVEKVSRELQKAKEDLASYRRRWMDESDCSRQVAERDAQRASAQIERLERELEQAKKANREPASGWNAHAVSLRRDESEEPTSKKKKLRQALDAAEQRIAAQDQNITALTNETKGLKAIIDSYRQHYEELSGKFNENLAALERERAANRKVVTAVVEAKLQGTGVSYSGALNGGYNPSRDGLAQRKQDELLAAADLARWQTISGKRKTARELDMNKSVEDQAVELAIAARWTLLSDPPKALRWRPLWAMWGFVLDDASEEYLCDLSTSATMDMTLAVPKEERRMRRY